MIGTTWIRCGGRAIAFVAVVGLCCAYSALCADIGGRVTDEANSPIHNATVVLRSILEPTKAFTVQTQDDGSYRLTSVPFGRYSIEATAPGFVGVRYGPIDIKHLHGERDFKLQVADVGEGGVYTDAELIGTLRTGERRHSGAKLCLSSKEKTKCVTANELGEYDLSIEVGKYSVTVTNEGKILWPRD